MDKYSTTNIKQKRNKNLFQNNLQKRKLKISHLSYNFLLIFQIVLFISLYLSKETKIKIRFLVPSYEITIKIIGKGNQTILNDNVPIPSRLFLNNDTEPLDGGKEVYNLESDRNTVKIVWDNNITSCYYMFFSRSNIEEINLSNFDSSLVTDISGMFFQCSNLKLIDFSNFNSEKVTQMNYVFFECISLQYLDLKNFNTQSVTSMIQMFFRCNSLISLDFSNFDTKSVTNMFQMFFECFSLIVLDLSNFNTSSVTTMYEMFRNCPKLEIINLNSFNTRSVKDMTRMFYGCHALKSIDLTSFDTSSVTSMFQIFLECKTLTSLNLSNFNTSLLTDMAEMFKGCLNLENLDLTNFNTSAITSMGNMFRDCNSLKSLNLSHFDTSNVVYFDNMFNGCKSLEKLDISNFDTSSAKMLNNMFSDCQSLKSLDLSNFNSSQVYSTNSMFLNCNNLISLELGNFDTSLVTDMSYMFSNCQSLASLNLNSFNTKSLNSSYQMFDNIKENFIYCINDIISEQIESQLQSYTKKNCSELCSDSKYIIEKNKCIDSCTYDNLYIFEYNNICFTSCPNGTYLFNNYLCKNNLNQNIYYYQINSNLDDLKKLYKNQTFIDFTTEELNFIYDQLYLDKEKDKLYVYIENFISNDSRMAIIDYNYKIFFENDSELNFNLIKDDIFINFYIPIKNLELAHFNLSQYFSEQGYDIYDKESDFYHEFCSPAYEGENDITLKDRRKYIYPNNVTLCKKNCIYNGIEREEKRIICSCNLNANKTNENSFQEGFIEDNGNFVSYFLDNINYKVFKCHSLISSFENLKNNYAFYGILGIFLVIVILNISFYCYSLPKLKSILLSEAPTDEKIREELISQLKSIRKNSIANVLNPIKKSKKKKKRKKSRKISSINLISNIIVHQNINIKNKNRKKIKSSTLNEIGNNQSPSIIKLVPKLIQETIKEDKLKNNIYTNEYINELPYSQAINFDKRNIWNIFCSFLIQKIELISFFYLKSHIKIILLGEYIFSLLINLFFNTLLFSDDIVSHKYHNNGELDIIVTLVLSILSNIITSIICYYLKYSKGIEERIDLIKEIKIKDYYIINVNTFYRYLRIKHKIYFIAEIIIVSCCYYYIVVFCIIYSRSIGSLTINYLNSLLEGLITSIVVTLSIIITRKIGLSYLSKNLYNTSKYINYKF